MSPFFLCAQIEKWTRAWHLNFNKRALTFEDYGACFDFSLTPSSQSQVVPKATKEKCRRHLAVFSKYCIIK
jgi:hypothetical protein